MMLLRDIMTTNLISIAPDAPASDAWAKMEHERIRHLLVMDEGRLVGILSIRDLGSRKDTAFREGKSVSDLMTPDVVTATPEMTLDDAFEIMRTEPIGSLPIVDGGEVIGIVTATDVLDELGRGGGTRTTARGACSRTRTGNEPGGNHPSPHSRRSVRTVDLLRGPV